MKNLKPAEIRSKIKRLVDQNKLEKLCLKTWTERNDNEHLDKKVQEQDSIILEATMQKLKFQHQHKTAKREISKIKQRIRYNNRVLANLTNYRSIEKLLQLAAELNECKETQDGEERSDTKV